MLEAPFKIGDVYWRPGGPSRSERVECPMCCGKKYITAIIGTGEKFEMECEECMAGYLGPLGYIEQYVIEPAAEKFVIDSVYGWDDGKWRVKSHTGTIIDFASLYTTEEEALAADVKRAAAVEEHNMADRRKKKYGKVSSWTIQYHQKQIKDHERQIEWHRKKLHAKQENQT